MPHGEEETDTIREDQPLLSRLKELPARAKLNPDLFAWIITPVCALLVMAGTEPYMMYSLYHAQLQTTLGLTAEEAGDVQSFGTIGGLCLAFLPGLIYDHYGFSASLLTGGLLSTLGALFWYVLLMEGGSPGSPSWMSLAASFLMLGLGTRFLFISGMCAVLDVFPTHLAPRVSTVMSLCSALGALVFPLIWRGWYLPKETLPVPEDHPAHPRLMPVAHFHLMLVLVYIGATVMGLCLGPILPQKLDERRPALPSLKKFLTPPALLLLMMTTLTIPLVYEYLGSAMAPLGKKALEDAGVVKEEAQQAQAKMTTAVCAIGLAGRLLIGVCADWLMRKPGFQTAAMYLMYLITSVLSVLGFALLEFGHRGDATSVPLWKAGTYTLAMAFASFFALIGGSIRVWFPRQEIGTWFGFFLCVVGVMNFGVARLAAAAEFSATFWRVAVASSCVSCVTAAHLTYAHWLKDQAHAEADSASGPAVAGPSKREALRQRLSNRSASWPTPWWEPDAQPQEP